MTPSATIAPAAHVRQHRSVLAGLEKRLLIWIARRLPAWVSSDHLTALGLLSMGLVGAAFAWSARDPRVLYLVPVLLAVNWFGDSLDGTVARVRNRQRPRYGYYVDHVVDIAGAVALFGFGPTELRIVLAAGALALVGRPQVSVPWLGRVPLFDVGGTIAIAGISLAFVMSSVQTARRLAREERLDP